MNNLEKNNKPTVNLSQNDLEATLLSVIKTKAENQSKEIIETAQKLIEIQPNRGKRIRTTESTQRPDQHLSTLMSEETSDKVIIENTAEGDTSGINDKPMDTTNIGTEHPENDIFNKIETNNMQKTGERIAQTASCWRNIIEEQENEESEDMYINKTIRRRLELKRPINEINEELELKYPRKTYSVLLFGNGLERYKKDIHQRVAEIERCVNVKSPMQAQIIIAEHGPEPEDKEISIKVTVDNYDDYKRLMGTWPTKAFDHGVKVEVMPTNLQVIITNVDNKISINEKSQLAINLEMKYGLVNAERIMYGEKPSNKIKATAKRLIDYINAIKTGVYLDDTSKNTRSYIAPKIQRFATTVEVYTIRKKTATNIKHV